MNVPTLSRALAVACLAVTASASIAGATEIVSNVLIDGAKVDQRQQLVDVVDVGQGYFAVGYIHTGGGVRYAYYRSSDGALEVGPFDTGPPGKWLRASGSKSLIWRNCSGTKAGAVGLFAVHVGGEVYLDQHTRCNGAWRAHSFMFVDHGDHPSVATSGDYNNGRALLVYGQGSQLRGAFVTITPTGKTVGSSFPIQDLNGAGIFSTDLVFNTKSNQFIVGYIVRKGGTICQIRNVVVADANPPVVGTPSHFGDCDTDVGGHHTSVAFNTLGNGDYAWFRQDKIANNSKKGVYVHNSSGQFTGTSFPHNGFPGLGAYAWTMPVSPTYSSTSLYVIARGGGTSPATVLYAVDASNTLTRIDDVFASLPAAIRSVGSETAVVTHILGDVGAGTGAVYLNVSSFP
jgi:hypothetical protein